jgi:hypothetical protein
MIPPVRIAIAAFIGLIVTAALSIATDMLMIALGIFPKDGDVMTSQGLLVLASAYRAVFSILGAFVAAAIAGAHFMSAVRVLGGVATVLAVFGIFAMWRKWNGPTAWYPISLAVLAIPYCLIGGKLYGRYKSVKS